MTSNLIPLLANVALTLSFIVGLTIGITQVRVAARDRRERFALETLRTFQTREFAELIQYILSHDFPTDYKGFRERPAEEQTCFIHFAQEMESLGILVSEKLIDIELIVKTLGVFVANAWQQYKPMYQDMRDKLPDPFLGEYFQWLAEYIDHRMYITPRFPMRYVKHK